MSESEVPINTRAAFACVCGVTSLHEVVLLNVVEETVVVILDFA